MIRGKFFLGIVICLLLLNNKIYLREVDENEIKSASFYEKIKGGYTNLDGVGMGALNIILPYFNNYFKDPTSNIGKFLKNFMEGIAFQIENIFFGLEKEKIKTKLYEEKGLLGIINNEFVENGKIIDIAIDKKTKEIIYGSNIGQQQDTLLKKKGLSGIIDEKIDTLRDNFDKIINRIPSKLENVLNSASIKIIQSTIFSLTFSGLISYILYRKLKKYFDLKDSLDKKYVNKIK